ncbi:ROK family transcriptional regulator [Marinococcus sp. PL1-022]|uniref:ROK family transcriptional regulator n=1 Tax=Marinococcus sp. PL1-022 TaxID=3095363 RepID=UPI0029C18ECC|nr:ROK family transcriptional regulator [Marinococcus sp. PL1-022]MDX6154039.1 ROK family transcriptional regulator [Marinococcus sp. PL1-022]
MTVTNANMLKTANRRRVFELLHRSEEPMTQQEMAKTTGLTVASVGNILVDLEKARLLQEAGQALSNGGRKPTLYTLDGEWHYLVGVSISVEEVVLVITTLKGEIIYRETESFSLTEEPETVIGRVIHELQKIVNTPEFRLKKMVGIGISSPGPVNADKGTILSPPHLPLWRNIQVVSLFEEAFAAAVCLEKDANCMLLGEWHYGHAREAENVLYFMIDFGIGSSYIINGQLFRGTTHLAGEVGFDSSRLRPKNNVTGKALYSILPIIEETKGRIHRGDSTSLPKDLHSIEEFIEGLAKGDPLAQEIIQESMEDVSCAIADKVNFLNPELVVIGGRLITAVPDFPEEAERIVRECVYPETAGAMEFISSKFGQEAEAMGAASLILKRALH